MKSSEKVQKSSNRNWDKYLRQFSTNGYFVLEGVFKDSFVKKCRSDLEKAIKKETEFLKDANTTNYAMVVMCPLYGASFLKVFDNPDFTKGFEMIMGTGSIIYSYTSSSMPPNATNYSYRVHVDCPRIIPNFITNMGAIIALDDFKKENGATWVLRGSHTRPDQPTEHEFFKHAKQIECKAGDVIYLNSRLWHSGGLNKTAKWRHSTTVGVCRPWMKQRLDFPRMLSKHESSLSDVAKQKFGFWTQVPASYDEYFAPPEKRKYRQKAE